MSNDRKARSECKREMGRMACRFTGARSRHLFDGRAACRHQAAGLQEVVAGVSHPEGEISCVCATVVGVSFVWCLRGVRCLRRDGVATLQGCMRPAVDIAMVWRLGMQWAVLDCWVEERVDGELLCCCPRRWNCEGQVQQVRAWGLLWPDCDVEDGFMSSVLSVAPCKGSDGGFFVDAPGWCSPAADVECFAPESSSPCCDVSARGHRSLAAWYRQRNQSSESQLCWLSKKRIPRVALLSSECLPWH